MVQFEKLTAPGGGNVEYWSSGDSGLWSEFSAAFVLYEPLRDIWNEIVKAKM